MGQIINELKEIINSNKQIFYKQKFLLNCYLVAYQIKKKQILNNDTLIKNVVLAYDKDRKPGGYKATVISNLQRKDSITDKFFKNYNDFIEAVKNNTLLQVFKEKKEIISINEKQLQLFKDLFTDNNIKEPVETKEVKTETQIKNTSSNNSLSKNIILYGPPGTGKTYSHKKVIAIIENGDDLGKIFDNKYSFEDTFNTVKDDDRFQFITFHQSYSYEDFIEGFRPVKEEEKNFQIKLQDGIFKDLCDSARKDSEKNYYLVIDEINRGNISKIFGELITLIEDDKRDYYEVDLPYSKSKFSVPSNIYIIATMNTADKSIALLDVALRRRFIFVEMKPDITLISNELNDSYVLKIIEKTNKIIEEKRGKDYKIGHGYFMQNKDINFIIRYQIIPLLEEYFYGENLSDVFKKEDDIINFYGLSKTNS
ncbi:MAG: AAA family ATPase [Bacteroidales bacterium]|nr:AAA family ATPase [Bacteroidales bacterium]